MLGYSNFCFKFYFVSMFLFSALGFFKACLRARAGSKYAYAYNWLCQQAYVCACILVPRNPNFFFPSISLFLSYHMLVLTIFYVLSLFLCLIVCLPLTC